MAGLQLTAAAPPSAHLRSAPSTLRMFSAASPAVCRRGVRGLTVKAATVVAPKYTSIKPLGDRVLVKVKSLEEKTTGGIFLPTTAQSKPQGGEVVAVGEGRSIGNNEVPISVEAGAKVIYSKYAGTELEFNGTNHLLLKEDDIVGILDTDDVKDLKPLNDRVLIKIAEAEEETAGGLLLTGATKEKPAIGTVSKTNPFRPSQCYLDCGSPRYAPQIGVIAVGPGALDEEGKRKPLTLATESTVFYSKYAGSEFKGADGSEYVVLKASDVIAVLPC